MPETQTPEPRAGYGRFIALVVVVGLMGWAASRLKDALRPDTLPVAAPSTARGPDRAPSGPLPVRLRSGQLRDLGARPGKVLIVHFWATWCPPCVEEMPGLVAYARQIRERKDLELVTVSVDDGWNTVEPWLAVRGASDIPLSLDPERSVAHRFGTEKFPETYVLSPDGAILLHAAGPLDWGSAELRQEIDGWARGSRG